MVTVHLTIPLLFTLSWTTAMSADHILSEDSFTRAKGSVILPGLSVRDLLGKRKDRHVDVGQSSTADQLGLTQQRRSEAVKKSIRRNSSKRNDLGADLLSDGRLEKKHHMCGEIGNRCNQVPVGTCVLMCVRDEYRPVCRVQHLGTSSTCHEGVFVS